MIDTKYPKSRLREVAAFFVTVLLVSQVALGESATKNNSGTPIADNSPSKARAGLEEVYVTATKRGDAVSIQDTSMSITALSQETIEKRGLLELSDYINTIAGVSLFSVNATDQRIFIRGLALSGSSQTSVSTYLGDMPLSTAVAGTVNLRLVDIERIEVLKGPQGTLYGSSASSGTLRYIPVKPNLDEIEGSITANFITQAESDETGQSLEGVINIPFIQNELGLRVAAYHYNEPGYIDSISTPGLETVSATTGTPLKVEKDVNGGETSGVRASLLWRSNESLDINIILGAQRQEFDQDNLTHSGYEVPNLDLGAPALVNDVDYANLVVEYDLGWGALTSSSSVADIQVLNSLNYSSISESTFIGPVNFIFPAETDIVSQEFRFASQLDGPWQFLTGLYYEDVQREGITQSPWVGTGTNPFAANRVPGEYLNRLSVVDYQQKAIFGEVNYEFNDQWVLTLGARHYDYDREDRNYDFQVSDEAEIVDASKKGETFKADLSYTPDDDTLIYALWSEGFRLGKGQTVPAANICDVDNDGRLDGSGGAELTPSVEPDTTENFELGAKFSFLENHLTLNAAIYRIDWSNLPVTFRANMPPACPGNVNTIANNVAEARSEGVEVEVAYRVSSNLKFDLALAYNEAEVTEAGLNSTVFEVGEDLPFAPHSKADLGVEYNFDLGASPAFIRTELNYFGEAEATRKSSNFPTVGDYVTLNVRAGVNMNEWDFSVYGSNLTNEDTSIYQSPPATQRLVPRRLGVEAMYRF